MKLRTVIRISAALVALAFLLGGAVLFLLGRLSGS
jgi:hypothetical protein